MMITKDFFWGLFGGLIIIGALFVFSLIYLMGALIVLGLLFATIARLSYNGDGNKLGLYRGLMITTYVFLLLLGLGMLLCGSSIGGIIGFVLSMIYCVFLVFNMVATFKANVVDVPINNTYYNPYMNYGQTYNNANYYDQNYENQNYNNINN